VWPSLLAAAATVWLILLVGAPYLPGYAAAVLYAVGSFVCHQIPERSFHLAGFQLPVCARCLGLYAGVSIGAAGRLWLSARTGPLGRAVATTQNARRLAVLAALPTLLTWLLEVAGLWAPSNLTRALAALPLGGVVGLVVAGALATVHYGECVPPQPIAPNPPPPSI